MARLPTVHRWTASAAEAWLRPILIPLRVTTTMTTESGGLPSIRPARSWWPELPTREDPNSRAGRGTILPLPAITAATAAWTAALETAARLPRILASRTQTTGSKTWSPCNPTARSWWWASLTRDRGVMTTRHSMTLHWHATTVTAASTPASATTEGWRPTSITAVRTTPRPWPSTPMARTPARSWWQATPSDVPAWATLATTLP